MKLIWGEVYSVGVKEFDEQHQKIFSLINSLDDIFLSKNYTDNNWQNLLEEISNYGDYHLSVEEKYLEDLNYPSPDKEEHIKQHNLYREKIESFNKKEAETEREVENLIFDMLDFLQDWWIKHINYTDKKYTEFFNQHRIQ